jgi:hypothetical protein
METGQWYTPRYSGRKVTLYRVKHITGSEIIMELWEFDKKSREMKMTDKYVPMDNEYFQTKSEAEGLVLLDSDLKDELGLPAMPQ